MLRPQLSLIAGVLLFAMPLAAAAPKAPKYPLHIQIRKAAYGCSNCEAADDGPPGSLGAAGAVGADDLANPNLATIDPDKHYFGQGRGVFLLDANKTQTFYFAYQDCLDPVPLTNAASLTARWKKPGHTLEVLVPIYSPNKAIKLSAKRMRKCQVDFSLQPISLVPRKTLPLVIGH